MTILRTAQRLLYWRDAKQPFRLFVGALVLVILLIGGGLAWRLLRTTTPPQVVTGQLLAWDIAETVRRAPDVQLATGAYLPGDRLLLYSRIAEPDRARVRVWALMQLEPFAERLATMASGETLTWVLDFGPTAAEQEVLLAPLNRATEAALYHYVSATQASTRLTPTTTITNTGKPVAMPAVTAVAVLSTTGTVNLASTEFIQWTFDDPMRGSQDWQFLAGDWVIANGIYSQRQTQGYDYMTMLELAPPNDYQMEAQLRLGAGEMGGGFIYNAPNLDTRRGAQSVDMDRQGGFMRWGRYDEQGNYVYEGGAKLEPAINDGQWHTLQLLTHGALSTFALDGRVLGQTTNRSQHGYLGLTTSQAQVDFDNVTITVLSPTAGDVNPLSGTTPVHTATRPLSATVAAFQDDFADGNSKRWRVLNGTWQFVDQSYQQLSTAGADLSSISTFQGQAYTVTVRMRQLDGTMGGGLTFNMAQREAKMRSQMISYTHNGDAIQWGYFDEGGNFVFDDMVDVPHGGDGEWHTLTVAVRQGQATFVLDQKVLARNVALTYTSGYVGLLVSNSKVAFDDFTVTLP